MRKNIVLNLHVSVFCQMFAFFRLFRIHKRILMIVFVMKRNNISTSALSLQLVLLMKK